MGENTELEYVACRVPQKLKEELEEIVEKSKKYVNVSDFVRQAIRDKLEVEKSLISQGGSN